ncbi:MAG: hypothetical protein FWE27_00215 [Defluviitaleaceae bacterium]|nr:hypothetical protein [Defluviitaleaceae bacterium]
MDDMELRIMIKEVMKEALKENKLPSPPNDTNNDIPQICPMCRCANITKPTKSESTSMGFSKKLIIFVSILFSSTWGVNLFKFISPDLDYSPVLMGLSTLLMGSSIGFYEVNEFMKYKYSKKEKEREY